MIDIFLLFDDTGSFESQVEAITSGFSAMIMELAAAYPETNFAFGVGRFEEYGGHFLENEGGRPFILNQAIIPASYFNEETGKSFDDYIREALARTADGGYGGDDAETLIEALYQIATGYGFDGDGDGSTTTGGYHAGDLNTQVNPGGGGDVPSIDSYRGETPLFGDVGGVGFRRGALPIIIVAGDVGTAYQPDGEETIYGAGGVEVPLTEFDGEGSCARAETPDGKGATIQETIDALNSIGALVFGTGWDGWGYKDPRRVCEAIAKLTGAVNGIDTPIDSGISGDPIEKGDPFYFNLTFDSEVWSRQVSTAIGAVMTNINFDVKIMSSDPRVKISYSPEILKKLAAGDLAEFDVTFTGDGEVHSFDLLFVRGDTGSDLSNAPIIGRIPVTISRPYQYDCDAIDADGDVLFYELLGETHGARINSETGELIWSPTAAGQYEFTVRVSDGRGGEDTQTWTINVKTTSEGNTAPTLDAVDDVNLVVGQDMTVQLHGHDDDGDVLTYYLVDSELAEKRIPSGLTIDRQSGRINWTPAIGDLGTYEITVRVVDGRGGETTETFTITVNQESVVPNAKPGINSVPVSTAVLGQVYRYDVSAYDTDHDSLTFSLIHAPDGMVIDSATGTIVWTPKPWQVTDHTVMIRVSDGRGGFAYQEFTITVVTELNDPPQIVSAPQGSIVLNKPWSYQVVAFDPNGDTLHYTLDDASLARGMTIDANGLVLWTPTEVGLFDVLITVEDGRGGQAMQMLTFNIASVAEPEITSTPQGPAFIGEEWTYTIPS